MAVPLIDPVSGERLECVDGALVSSRARYPIVRGVPRIAELDNYASTFGFQWNKFAATQIDHGDDADHRISERRFFAETRWPKGGLRGEDVLEVGSGAGRFSRVVLQHTEGTLYSVDYSDAVTANYATNQDVADGRFNLFQASIYELPFPPNSFDKVFCLGVLQHTPDFEKSVAALVEKAKPGGEIVVDFYPINGWWTKLNAKYILRPFTRRMSHERLLRLIEANIDWMIGATRVLHRVGLGALTRFLPICNVKDSFPTTMSPQELREAAVLDTFDQYSPEHDHPQRLRDVVRMFDRAGASTTFAGREFFGDGMFATVVRATKRATTAAN